MIENLLYEIDSCKDALEKEHLIQRLIDQHDGILTILPVLLQGADIPLMRVALQVVEILGFPKNASVIPSVLRLSGDEDAPLHHEALMTLVSMDFSVFPYIVGLAKKDDELAASLTKTLRIGMYRYVLNEQRTYNDPLIDQVIRELCTHPQEVMPLLAYILNTGIIELWPAAMRAIEAIGYPENKEAIPALIEHTMLGNDPIEGDALQMLQELGPSVVVPYFLEALWEMRDGKEAETRVYPSTDFVGLCELLLSRRFGRAYMLPCGPLLTYTFDHLPQKKQLRATKQLLSVLEAIGPDSAIYALPSLLDLVRKEGTSDVAQRARRLVASFDAAALAPYQLLMDSLGIRLEEERGESEQRM
ncbi:MAG: hypothetical protein M3Y81_09995 [Chloroflexota bacterium]|nr:hypothetical protein [Chloroflexota bacterium]